MVYLEKFILPTYEEEENILSIRSVQNGGACGYIDNSYPCGLFSDKELQELDFEPVTILYGGNGSGKSTLLNIIGKKLKLNSLTPYNSSEMIDLYLSKCKYRMGEDDYGDTFEVPKSSRIIKSDDIFDYMLAVRSTNDEISENTEQGKEDYENLKFAETIKLKGMDNYDEFRLQVLSRKKTWSRRKFLQKTAGKLVKLNSNGETAIDYFDKNLQNDALYLLDEPENSLSPKMCLKLKEVLEEKARYCNCQFIIATHSPFILSMKNAKIYDLDCIPVDLKKWWELENCKIYFEYFYDNKDLFLKKHCMILFFKRGIKNDRFYRKRLENRKHKYGFV